MRNDTIFIIVALLVAAILGYIIGYLTKGGNKTSSSTTKNVSSDNESALRSEIKNLEEKLKGCEQREKMNIQKIQSLEGGSSSAQATASTAIASSGAAKTSTSDTSSSGSTSSSSGLSSSGGASSSADTSSKESFDKGAAKEAMGKAIKVDDLKIVEGIGPKIESILKNNGIGTWVDLSNANPDNIKEILLRDGGENYRIHEPATWPKQAKMAADGDWKSLSDYQNKLKGGKEV